MVTTKENKVTWKSVDTTPRINGVTVITNLEQRVITNPQDEKDNIDFKSFLDTPNLRSNLIPM